MVLEKFSRYGLPPFVTENGGATNDDSLRCNFIKPASTKSKAIEGGINVIGYLYWTLMDNYESTMGTEPHFGLAAVDHKTQECRPRPCMKEFERVCLENRLIEPPLTKALNARVHS